MNKTIINKFNCKNIDTINDIINNFEELSKIVDSNLLQTLCNSKKIYSMNDLVKLFDCRYSQINYSLRKNPELFDENDVQTLNKEGIVKLIEKHPEFKDKIPTSATQFKIISPRGAIKLIFCIGDKYDFINSIRDAVLIAYNELVNQIMPKEIEEQIKIEEPVEIKTREQVEEDLIEEIKKAPATIVPMEENITPAVEILPGQDESIQKQIEDYVNEKVEEVKKEIQEQEFDNSKEHYEFDKLSFEFIDLYKQEILKIVDDELEAYFIASDTVMTNENIIKVLRNLAKSKLDVKFELKKSVFSKALLSLAGKKYGADYEHAYHEFARVFKHKTGFDLATKKRKENCRYADIIEKYDLWDIANETIEELLK